MSQSLYLATCLHTGDSCWEKVRSDRTYIEDIKFAIQELTDKMTSTIYR
ncbi:MAG TPA: hypothetical protein PKM51_09600 [Chitinophagales bacterium]|nr:hypothetical protein [Chitinophagales bacterium]